MLPPIVQWQKEDDNGQIFPWFTHSFLEVLKTWDLKKKVIMEWGGGRSSLWWARYAKRVHTIETSQEWINDIVSEMATPNISFYHRPVNEGDQDQVDFYTKIPEDCNPDIVVIDAILRHECLMKALTLPRPLTIIHDNWRQDGFICPASEELMAPYDGTVYIQEDHTDNHGNKWSTAVFNIK